MWGHSLSLTHSVATPVGQPGCHCWLVQQCLLKSTASKLAVAPAAAADQREQFLHTRSASHSFKCTASIPLATAFPQ